MDQLNFLASSKPPPTGSEIPILTVLKECYLLWHSFLKHLPRLTRYTLGVKIDNLFTELIVITLTAQYAKREEKSMVLIQLSQKLDHLKYFITILWETEALDNSKYAQLSQKLSSVGNQLGKWTQSILKKETPPIVGENKKTC